MLHSIFSSLGMMYAPQTVAPQHAQTAGMFAAAMLITGIFLGISSSVVHPIIVKSMSWNRIHSFVCNVIKC